MYKPDAERVNELDWEFMLSDRWPSAPRIEAGDPWLTRHLDWIVDTDRLAFITKERQALVNAWPSTEDGQDLSAWIQRLEAMFDGKLPNPPAVSTRTRGESATTDAPGDYIVRRPERHARNGVKTIRRTLPKADDRYTTFDVHKKSGTTISIRNDALTGITEIAEGPLKGWMYISARGKATFIGRPSEAAAVQAEVESLKDFIQGVRKAATPVKQAVPHSGRRCMRCGSTPKTGSPHCRKCHQVLLDIDKLAFRVSRVVARFRKLDIEVKPTIQHNAGVMSVEFVKWDERYSVIKGLECVMTLTEAEAWLDVHEKGRHTGPTNDNPFKRRGI